MTGNGTPPRLRNPLARITVFLGLLVLYQLGFALVVALLFYGVEAAPPGGPPPEPPPFHPFAGGRDTVLVVLSIAGTIALPLLAWRLVDRRPFSHLGLIRTRGEAGKLLFGTAAGGGLALLVFLIGTALRFGGIEAGEGAAGRPAIGILTIETLVLLAAAASEEVVFRGYLLSNFLQAGGPPYAVAFSAVLFAALHVLNPHFFTGLAPLNILLIGGVLALARLPAGGLAL
ncbi:MAG: CPBP family intramembrane metalloprotease, partial [Acidobacteria bacterium]|nr:CPBP family intramembrane metalloprotease [Acidobacteriota bacterium]